MVGLSKKRVFPKTKGDSITGQDRAQKHCDFRFSQIEKKCKVAVLQLAQSLKLYKHLEVDIWHTNFRKIGCILYLTQCHNSFSADVKCTQFYSVT